MMLKIWMEIIKHEYAISNERENQIILLELYWLIIQLFSGTVPVKCLELPTIIMIPKFLQSTNLTAILTREI